MERLIKLQHNNKDRIFKSLVNFKKSPKERINKEYIESRLEVLEELWTKVNITHCDIVGLSEDIDHQYFSEDEIGNIEELYLEYKTKLKLSLTSCEENANVKTDNYNMSSDKNSSDIKLPRIVIPTFSGQYSEWITFRDLFTSLIHSNTKLDNVQKIHYLKSYLSGDAEQLIRQIPIAGANYERCWSLLYSRFNNKKYLSHFILKRLLSQKNLVGESATGLKNLIDTTDDCLSSLYNLDIDVNTWDIIVIHIITLKLDPETRKQWEFSVTSSNASDELPTLEQFRTFLTNRYRALEFLDTKPASVNRNVISNDSNVNKVKTFHASSTRGDVQCPFCKESHHIINCNGFARESVDARRNFVQANNLCFNCLGGNHSVKFCRSFKKCRICRKQHHSLLHQNYITENNANFQPRNKMIPGESTSSYSQPKEPEPVVDSTNTTTSLFSARRAQKQVLLATALVKAAAKSGEHFIIRALLDQGSQTSFVTEATVQYLGLKKVPVTEQVSVLGGDTNIIPKKMVFINLKSMVDSSYNITVKAYVLRTITSLLPGTKLNVFEWLDTLKIDLADPNYHTPNKIDLLLGAEVYSKIIQEGLKKGPLGSPVVQCTSFGWIVSGEVNTEANSGPRDLQTNQHKTFHCQINDNDNDALKRFWELESDLNLTKQQAMTSEELMCEEMYNNTTTRDEFGRYIVHLPFKTNDPECKRSFSREMSENRWKKLKIKLNSNLEFCKKYEEVVEEYLKLGHMEEVPETELDEADAVDLPHHAVIRDDKDTTKLRVVFDASARGRNGSSLNDCLMVGPTIQPDLRHTMMRWRTYPICLVADIEKMYRMVRVTKQHADFQRIIWKDKETNKDKIFRLLTVTFGTASTPYLAIKSLQQIAIDEGVNYPLAAKITLNDFYVDDMLSGCESIDEGIKIYNEMCIMLSKGGFKLHKWSSNSNRLLELIKKKNENEATERGLQLKLDNVLKILGLTWDRSSDSFVYSVNIPEMQQPVTNRKILADVARLYDPLGWVAPSIIIAKAMIQKLWLAGITWDEVVPTNIMNEWSTYRNQLKDLSDFRLPRWLSTSSKNVHVELHGFCDASKIAYAALISGRM